MSTDYTSFVGRIERQTVTPEASAIEAFARAVFDDHPTHRGERAEAPPTYAFALAMAEGGFPFPTDGLIHAEQGFTFDAPLAAGVPLVIERSLSRARRRGDGENAMWILTWDVNAHDGAGRRVFSLSSRLLARPAASADGGDGDAPASGAAVAPPDEEGGGAATERVFVLDREAIRAYADASGDHNPIHLDDAFARSVGLSGIIAHGMLSMALVCQLAEEWAGPSGLATLSAKFSAPVAAGERVSARSSEDGGRLALSLFGADGTTRLQGKATRRSDA